MQGQERSKGKVSKKGRGEASAREEQLVQVQGEKIADKGQVEELGAKANREAALGEERDGTGKGAGGAGRGVEKVRDRERGGLGTGSRKQARFKRGERGDTKRSGQAGQ